MTTLDLESAAALLICHPETVRQMADAGELPAAKVGRAWVFVEVDLIAWLRTQYGREKKPCRSIETKKVRSGTSASRSKDAALEEALGLPLNRKPSRSTTNLKLISGNKNTPA